jgi:hypothetical protein
MQLPSMKASDQEEEEQKHVVAPLDTAEDEEPDDDEEEEQDKAETSMNRQDGDQGQGDEDPKQIQMVAAMERDLEMPIEHNEEDAAAGQNVVDVKTVVVEEVVEAVVEEREDMTVEDKEESVSKDDKSNEKKLEEEMQQNAHEAAVAHESGDTKGDEAMTDLELPCGPQSRRLRAQSSNQGDAPTRRLQRLQFFTGRRVRYQRVVKEMHLGGGCG